jgi:hypothetical protein
VTIATKRGIRPVHGQSISTKVQYDEHLLTAGDDGLRAHQPQWGPPQTTPGITPTPESCPQPATQAGSVVSPSNPPPQRGMVQPQSVRLLRQERKEQDPPGAERELPHRKRERGPTPKTLHATIRGIGKTRPTDTWGDPCSIPGAWHDAA